MADVSRYESSRSRSWCQKPDPDWRAASPRTCARRRSSDRRPVRVVLGQHVEQLDERHEGPAVRPRPAELGVDLHALHPAVHEEPLLAVEHPAGAAALVIRWTRPQEYFSESDWKGTALMDGGALLTQAIHYIDSAQYILGPAREVFGVMVRKAHEIEVEDMAQALIQFNCGTHATLEFSINTYPHNIECSLSLMGEKGTVKIGGLAMNQIDYWNVANVPKPEIPVGNQPNVYAGGMYTGSCPNHKQIYQNVANHLLYGRPNLLSADEALEAIKIIDGIKASSEKKRTIVFK